MGTERRDDKRHGGSPLTEHEIMVLREEMLSDDGFLPEGKARVARLCDMALASIVPSAVAPLKPVAWRYRYKDTGEWRYADTQHDCNPLPDYQRQPLYTAPPSAGGALSDAMSINIDALNEAGWKLLECAGPNPIHVNRCKDVARAVLVAYINSLQRQSLPGVPSARGALIPEKIIEALREVCYVPGHFEAIAHLKYCRWCHYVETQPHGHDCPMLLLEQTATDSRSAK